MNDQGTQSELPAPRRNRRWLIFAAVGVGLCAIIICVIVVGSTLLSPALNAARLPNECMANNPDLDAQACATWAQNVATTAEFQTCLQEGMSSGQTGADVLYACLVREGVGP